MKKQSIEFKELEYKESIEQLNYVVELINNTIPILVLNGIEPTFEVIKELFTNRREFSNKKFKEELHKISNNVGLSIDYVMENRFNKTEWLFIGANNKIQFIWNIESLCYLYYWCFSKKYIDIVNGIAKLINDCLDILEDEFTIYTETAKQNEILPIIQEIANQYNKLGENGNKIKTPLLYKCNGEYKINGSLFKQLF